MESFLEGGISEGTGNQIRVAAALYREIFLPSQQRLRLPVLHAGQKDWPTTTTKTFPWFASPDLFTVLEQAEFEE